MALQRPYPIRLLGQRLLQGRSLSIIAGPRVRSVASLVEELGLGPPTVLKIDVEGSEHDVLLNAKTPALGEPGRASGRCVGGDVLSHRAAPAVPSALWGLTAVFGMGTGVTPTL